MTVTAACTMPGQHFPGALPDFQQEYTARCREAIVSDISLALESWAYSAIYLPVPGYGYCSSKELGLGEQVLTSMYDDLRWEFSTEIPSPYEQLVQGSSTVRTVQSIIEHAFVALRERFPTVTMSFDLLPLRFGGSVSIHILLTGDNAVWPAWWWATLVQRLSIHIVQRERRYAGWKCAERVLQLTPQQVIPYLCECTGGSNGVWFSDRDAQFARIAWENPFDDAEGYEYIRSGCGPADLNTAVDTSYDDDDDELDGYD